MHLFSNQNSLFSHVSDCCAVYLFCNGAPAGVQPARVDYRVHHQSFLLVLQKNPMKMGYGSKQQEERGPTWPDETREFGRHRQ
jgi:hypothetical protein